MVSRVYVGILEKNVETTIVYWGYIGIMETRMETTIVSWGYIGGLSERFRWPTYKQNSSSSIALCVAPSCAGRCHECVPAFAAEGMERKPLAEGAITVTYVG